MLLGASLLFISFNRENTSGNIHRLSWLLRLYASSIALIFFMQAVHMLVKHANNYTKKQLSGLIFYLSLLLVPFLFVQEKTMALLPVFQFFAILALLKNRENFSMESENIRDEGTLERYISSLLRQQNSFRAILLDTTQNSTESNISVLKHTLLVQKQLDNWLSDCRKCKAFRYRHNSFVLLTSTEKSQQDIRDFLEDHLPINIREKGKKDIVVNVHLICTEDLQGATDAYEICSLFDKYLTIPSLSVMSDTGTLLQDLKNHRQIEHALRKALEDHSLSVYLQPLYCPEKDAFVSAEALARIEDDELGLLMPDQFIPIAEEKGLINQIGFQILEATCRYLKSTQLPRNFERISINLSVSDCLNPHLAEDILSLMGKYQVSPSRFILEITESISSKVPFIEETMLKLQQAGIQFAIDDFGTGYANLDAVLRLPFDIIKLDRSLLYPCEEEDSYRILVSGLIELINNLGLSTVVEGIETKHQAQMIQSMMATYQQGFLYSRPIPMHHFTRLLNKQAILKALS
jgi:EAL domain-containing protein (putative c-di-GMP-specific phosphodiesterase class I)